MAAVWSVKDGRIRMLGRVTWEFPVGDFLPAVRQLLDDLDREREESQEPAPLPRADIPGVGVFDPSKMKTIRKEAFRPMTPADPESPPGIKQPQDDSPVFKGDCGRCNPAEGAEEIL